MAHFKSNQRGGLSVDRDSLHASPEFKRQIAALNKLSENPMTLPQNVEDRIQKLSDRKLSVWQEMASTWLPGSTVQINADAFLSLIAEVRRCRAHLLSQEAEIELLRVGCEQNLLHAQMAESRLAAANALLREAIGWNWLDDDAPGTAGVNTDNPSVLDELYMSIQSHLQGAGDEA